MRGSVYKYTRTTRKTQPVCRLFVCFCFCFFLLSSSDNRLLFSQSRRNYGRWKGVLLFFFVFFVGGFIYSDCMDWLCGGCCSRAAARQSTSVTARFFFLLLPLASSTLSLSYPSLKEWRRRRRKQPKSKELEIVFILSVIWTRGEGRKRGE